MRLLILGASGFLGRHVADAAQRDPRVEPIVHRHAQLDLLGADDSALADLLAEADVVVNCVGTASGDAERLERLNVVVVARLVRAVGARRLIQLGSAAEYGAVPEGMAIDERTPTSPVSNYGAAKLRATQIMLAAREPGTLDGVVLRVFNPIGPGMPPGSLPADAARQMREAREAGRERIELGPLDSWRDYVDARAVASAVLAAALADGVPPVVNIGSGVATRTRDLVERLAAVAGFRGELDEQRPGSPRSALVAWQQADIGLARTALGWEPHHTLDDSLRALWDEVCAS